MTDLPTLTISDAAALSEAKDAVGAFLDAADDPHLFAGALFPLLLARFVSLPEEAPTWPAGPMQAFQVGAALTFAATRTVDPELLRRIAVLARTVAQAGVAVSSNLN